MEFDTFVIIGMLVLVVFFVNASLFRRRADRMQQRVCRACGAPHPSFAQFCRRCGQRLL